jgi:MFS family permease
MDRNIKRNFFLLFVDIVIFVNAMTFLSVNTIILYFLDTLGASTVQISLSSILVNLGTLMSQPLFSRMAVRAENRLKTFIRVLNIQRLFFLGFIFTIPFLATANPGLMVIAFLVSWGIFNFFTGSYSPFYMSLFSKMVPDNLRGRLLGLGGAVANVVALGTALLVGVLLEKIPYPLNYTVIFGVGILLLLLDNLTFKFMIEPPDDDGKEIQFFRYSEAIREIFKTNKKFLRLVSGYVFFVIANVSLIYYSLYAIRVFGAGAGEITLFMAISVIANTLGNVFFGFLSDRFGHRLILIIGALFGITAGIFVVTVHSLFAVYIAFALSSLCSTAYYLSSGVLIIQNSPQKQIPIYIGINSMATLIISSVIALVGGAIINSFSFMPVFIMTGSAAVFALAIMMTGHKRS